MVTILEIVNVSFFFENYVTCSCVDGFVFMELRPFGDAEMFVLTSILLH